MDNCQSYTALADCYDRLMKGADYSGWADFITEYLKSYGIEPGALMLELGCGTGSMTVELARRGWDMTALDLSPDMLIAAREKIARPENADIGDILLLCQDMRSFELYGTMAAVVCVLDGINYLTETRDLRACFKTVMNYLDPGGVFIFDVNTPYKFKNIFGQREMILEDEGVFCGWKNNFDRESLICEFDLTIFKQEESGEWYRFSEKQYERCYGITSLTKNLERAGFEEIKFFSGYSKNIFSETDERWVISAVKPRG